MVYEPVFGLDNICKRFSDVSHDTNNHFVEGLQYNLNEAVIMAASMVPDHEVNFTNVIDIQILITTNFRFHKIIMPSSR